jgi:hypothetical protein
MSVMESIEEMLTTGEWRRLSENAEARNTSSTRKKRSYQDCELRQR